MKKQLIFKVIIMLTLVFGMTSMSAQTRERGGKQRGNPQEAEFIAGLSERQQQSYDTYKNVRKSNRTTFNATFSDEQLAIANDRSLDRETKRKALMATFTKVQRSQKQLDRKSEQKARTVFMATLSENQKYEFENLKSRRRNKK